MKQAPKRFVGRGPLWRRVFNPRTIKGLECRRIGMRKGRIYWLYDKPNAPAEARRSRSLQPDVGRLEGA